MAAEPKPDMTLLDRAIAYFVPGWAKARLRDRAIMALAGGYHGASRRRTGTAGWRTDNADADTVLSWDRPILVERSHDLVRNNPLAGGAINTNVTNVVGSGLTMQAAIDYQYLGLDEAAAEAWQTDTERRFRLWWESPDCDVTRHDNGYGLQSLAFRSMLESGDIIALLPIVDRAVQGETLTVQLIESERLSNPFGRSDTKSFVSGVEQEENGAPFRYHICDQHPGNYRPGAHGRTWTGYPAFGATTGRRNVLHLFERRRPGQSRGIPYLAPVIESLKQLGRYTDAEIAAAVNSAALVVFTKIDPKLFQELFDEDPGIVKSYTDGKAWDGSIPTELDGPGKAINLIPGESVDVPELGRPNDKFDPFVQAIMRLIGIALELPYEVLIKHFTASYSAAQAALLDAYRIFRVKREWLAVYFCQPIYEEWLAFEIASGRISAPGYFAPGMTGRMLRAAWSGALWTGDGQSHIRPDVAIAAAQEAIDLGISTIASESIKFDGIDWETKHRQRVREIKARRSAGLEESPLAAQTAASSDWPQ